jgi:hypothetical protein
MSYEGVVVGDDGVHVGIISAEELRGIFEDQNPPKEGGGLEYRIRAIDEARNEAVTQIYFVIINLEESPSPGNHG